MYLQVNKTKDNKSKLVANLVSQKKRGGESNSVTQKKGEEKRFGFIDNRSDAIFQRKLQDATSIEQQANRSITMQRLIGNFSTQQLQPIQMLHGSFDPASYAGANSPLDIAGVVLAAMGIGGIVDSVILRLNLLLAGVPDSNNDRRVIGNQAHHIVEAHDVNALHARNILAAAAIDINSAVNGVLLPTAGSDDTGEATVHFGGHVAAYADAVNAALDVAIATDNGLGGLANAGRIGGALTGALIAGGVHLAPAEVVRLQGIVIGVLNAIRNLLLTTSLPINQKVDDEWFPDGSGDKGGRGGGHSIRRHFNDGGIPA